MGNEVFPVRAPFPRTILGYDGTDFYAVKVDDDGRVVVQGEDQLFSIGDTYDDQAEYTASGAEDKVLSLTAIGPGKLVVVTQISALCTNAAIDQIWVGVHIDGHDRWLNALNSPAAAEFLSLSGQFVLGPEDYVSGIYYGMQNNNVARLLAIGYEMTLAT